MQLLPVTDLSKNVKRFFFRSMFIFFFFSGLIKLFVIETHLKPNFLISIFKEFSLNNFGLKPIFLF